MSIFFTKKEIRALMRITLTQLILIGAITSRSLASPVLAQELLKERVTLNLKNSNLRSFLRTLEKQVDIVFSYQKGVIATDEKLTVTIQNETVDNVLRQVLTPRRIYYRVINTNQVILTRVGDGETGTQSLPNDPRKTVETNESQQSQEVSISGRVIAENGEGLPGVNIQIKATTRGTTTDANGEYKLTVPGEPGTTLVFSFIGYVSQEVAVNNQPVINVTLVADDKTLGEVVVVGYGTQQKATLTGSVAQIAGREVTKSPTPNVVNSLAGRLPGLVVNQRSGEPGRDDPSILIRGLGTTGDNSPLIIIDGVQRSLIGRLNPQDIESISVLKDASAAIYGARAANGVILVTTKKGTIGKPTFDFSYNYAFLSPTKVPTMLDAATFAEAFNEGDWYRKGRPATYTPFYSDAALQKYRDESDPVLYPNTNWVKEVLKPYSSQQRATLQVTGGSNSVRYLLSLGSLSQDGNFRYNPTQYKQYNFRTKIDVDLTKDLTVGANIYAILNNRTYSSTSTNINFINILQANPTLVSQYPNGLIGPGRLGENPLLQDQVGTTKLEDFPLYSTFTATYKVPFVEGLRLDGSFNYDISNQFEKTFRTPYSYYEYNVNTQNYDKKNATVISTPELTNISRNYTTLLYNLRINYDRIIGQHHIGIMVGNEQQKNTFRELTAYRKNFVSTSIDQLNVGSNAPADKNNSGTASASAYNNYFGRLNYDYAAKYLLELVFRYDGSQIFPVGKRYGFFPGFSAGWRLSEEKFIRNNLPFVNQLKLRVSHGQIGNDRVGQFQYLQAYSFGDNFVFGGNDVPGLYPNIMPNPNITWEISNKTDVGLDASLWRGLLGMEFTYWNQKRTNILAPRNLSVSHVYGFSGLPNENIGQVNSHGFELVLTHRNTIGGLTYNLAGNLAYANSKIVFLDEAPQPEPYQNQTDHPVGAGLYYKADGIFHTQEELNAYPHGAGAQVGDIKVLDLNGDGKIDSKDQYRFDYSATPRYTFGLNTNFQYRNFDLNLFFQGQTGAYNYDGTVSTLGGSDFANAAAYRATNRWTASNPNGTMPRADMWQPGTTTFFLNDATFVRLKTAEFGYTLPKSLTNKIKFNSTRIYVSGFNLLTWAKVIKWADPEIAGDFTTYPPQRTINLGVNVTF